MPDVHWGIGATVGSVIPTRGRDHPGGGRRRHRLRHDGGRRPRSPRATCPTTSRGCARRSSARCRTAAPTTAARGDRGAWDAAAEPPRRGVERSSSRGYDADRREAPEARPAATTSTPRHARHRQPLHRGLPRRGGPRVVHAAQRLARRRQPHRHVLHRAREAGHARRCIANLPDKDLAYFPEGTEHFDDYVEAVGWAQDFALHEPRADDGARCVDACARRRACRRSRSARARSTATTTTSRASTTSARTCS